jgi:hypothetical protein
VENSVGKEKERNASEVFGFVRLGRKDGMTSDASPHSGYSSVKRIPGMVS